MGTRGSSSRRKSSSSLKKKRSKIPSEVRRRKRNWSRSRKNKTKKSRRRDDSISNSDEDYRRIPVSYSSSDSDDGYKKKRSRSRTRKNVKGTKKRARTSSSSQESSQDSFRYKKRKGSKKTGNADVRKKTYKKKPRRDMSVSSASSDSWSCPSCRGGTSSSSYGNEYVRPREKSEKDGRDKKSEEKIKCGNERSRYRSRSSSSCSVYSHKSGNEERLMVENHSRRLRSVITFAQEPDEKDEKELDKGVIEEEIIYDHDDYPCKSGDSNDGGNKKDLAHYSNVAPEKQESVENIEREETYTEVAGSDKDGGDERERSNRSLYGGENNPYPHDKGKSEVSSVIGSTNADDLESILRQKALENLRKFRGIKTCPKPPAEQTDKSDSDVKQSSSAKADLVQSKPPKEDVVIKSVGRALAVDHTISPKTVTDSTCSSLNEGKNLVKRNVTRIGFAKQDMISPADNLAASGNQKENSITAAGVITELGKPLLRQKSPSTRSNLKQVLTSSSQTSPKENSLVNEGSVYDNLVENKTVACISNNQVAKVNTVSSSCVPPEPSSTLKSTHGEGNLKELQAGSNEGSQYEKKTMSVMRGGEMVQVSYKVYIPKKAPALGRRQLQR